MELTKSVYDLPEFDLSNFKTVDELLQYHVDKAPVVYTESEVVKFIVHNHTYVLLKLIKTNIPSRYDLMIVSIVQSDTTCLGVFQKILELYRDRK